MEDYKPENGVKGWATEHHSLTWTFQSHICPPGFLLMKEIRLTVCKRVKFQTSDPTKTHCGQARANISHLRGHHQTWAHSLYQSLCIGKRKARRKKDGLASPLL